jgi:hypothetical protein
VAVTFGPSDTSVDTIAVIKLVEDGSTLEIPLRASAPAPDVAIAGAAFADGVLQFGRVVADGRMHNQTLQIQNSGTSAAKYQIVRTGGDALPLEMRPAVGEIPPGGSQEVFVGVSSQDSTGPPHTVSFEVQVEGQIGGPVPFRVEVALVGHVLKVIGHGEPSTAAPLQTLDLGCVYYSTRRSTNATLVNDGPHHIQYSVSVVAHDRWVIAPGGAKVPEFSQDEDGDLADLAVVLDPPFGEVEPRGRLTIKFHFHPKAEPPEVGWEKDYRAPPRRNYKFVVEACAVGTDMVSHFVLEGAAMSPAFTLSTRFLSFRDCAVGQSDEAEITLVNESNQLPLSVDAQTIAHYDVSPQTAVVLPKQELVLRATFRPRQAGPLERELVLAVAEQTVTVPLRLQGSCVLDAHSLERSRGHRLKTIGVQLETKTAFRFGLTPVTSEKAQYFSDPNGRQRHGMHPTANPNARLKPVRPNKKPFLHTDPELALSFNQTAKQAVERGVYDSFVKELGRKRQQRIVTKRRNSARDLHYNGGIGDAPESVPPPPPPPVLFCFVLVTFGLFCLFTIAFTLSFATVVAGVAWATTGAR